MRHYQSFERLNSLQSFMDPGNTNRPLEPADEHPCPPSTRFRIAQRMHLVRKTFYSIHDAERQSNSTKKSCQEQHSCCEQLKGSVEQAISVFGPEGFQLQTELRETIEQIASGFDKISQNTTEYMTRLAALCKNTECIEKEYVKSHKALTKAQAKLSSMSGGNAAKIGVLTRELQRKAITCNNTRLEYEDQTLGVALQLTYGFLQQHSFNCERILEAFSGFYDISEDKAFPSAATYASDRFPSSHSSDDDQYFVTKGAFTPPLESQPSPPKESPRSKRVESQSYPQEIQPLNLNNIGNIASQLSLDNQDKLESSSGYNQWNCM